MCGVREHGRGNHSPHGRGAPGRCLNNRAAFTLLGAQCLVRCTQGLRVRCGSCLHVREFPLVRWLCREGWGMPTHGVHAAGACQHTGYMQLGYADTRGTCGWGMPTHGVDATGVCRHTGYKQLGHADTRGIRSWGMPTHGVHAAGACQHTGEMRLGYANTRGICMSTCHPCTSRHAYVARPAAVSGSCPS